MKDPMRIVVTGAAGQIAYLLMHPLCNGDIFGKDQTIVLHLFNTARRMTALQGLVMEIVDSNYPLLKNIISTDNEQIAFQDVDVAIFLGSVPRKVANDRKELLNGNVKIFQSQGIALDKFAKKTVKVLVVSNPANTNCYILACCAPSIPRENFTCLTLLDHNRARTQIASRLQVLPDTIKNIIIWGNHSSTVFPDVHFATVSIDNRETSVYESVQNDNWLRDDFIATVRKRGGDIIAARNLTSSISAAKAIADHLESWWYGTKENEWVSMGIISDGSYDVEKGLVFSYPVQIKNGKISIVKNLKLDDWSIEMIDKTHKELIEEKHDALQKIHLIMMTNLVKLQTIEQLSPLVLRVLGCNPSPMTLQGTNTYLIGKGRNRLLLDAGQGVPAYVDELKDTMKTNNIGLQAILITHWHPDHICGIKDVLKLIDKPDLPVYKRKLFEMPDLKKLQTYGMPENPDEVANFTFINNGTDQFNIETEGAHLKAIHTPGHTTDHLCFWLEEEQALFSGDTILGQGTTEFEDLYDYLNSLQLILKMSPKIIYPGHGPVVENPQQTLEHYISHRQQRNNQILDALKQSNDGLDPNEITKIVYTDLPEGLFHAACHNVCNHLQMLEKENLVCFNVQNKKWSLRANSSI
ncbi:unnamed protein product [Rotaria socialis]|uniref:Malate dehydrogenase, cytoplasmic n=1 Tax=Rotaria socialis TaxID=392032 RepID=A0A818KJR4_9BILA|nr:unnamed protein product [Rotaria socialis]CAF4267400.1 unnamed protein product [Rotaria socialis]